MTSNIVVGKTPMDPSLPPPPATFADIPSDRIHELAKHCIANRGNEEGASLHDVDVTVSNQEISSDQKTGDDHNKIRLQLIPLTDKNVKGTGRQFVIVTDMNGILFDVYGRIGLEYGTQMRAYLMVNGNEVGKKGMEEAGFEFWSEEEVIHGETIPPHTQIPSNPPTGHDEARRQ